MQKVLVATSTRAETARFIDFYRTRDALVLPLGSECRLYPGFFPNYPINDAVLDAINGGFTHLFIVDDDQMLPPDTVERLLKHDVDIVACNLLTRTPPFGPYMFRDANEDGVANQIELPSPKVEGPLIEVHSCGTGGILIKTEVFRKLDFPFFYHDDILKTYDMYFCRNARRAGFKIHVDLSCPSGHIALCAIWPKLVNGEWKTIVIVANSIHIEVPMAKQVDKNTLRITDRDVIGEEIYRG